MAASECGRFPSLLITNFTLQLQCGNFWLDFNLTEQRIVRFTCGGSA
jgi:hypothetical protein